MLYSAGQIIFCINFYGLCDKINTYHCVLIIIKFGMLKAYFVLSHAAKQKTLGPDWDKDGVHVTVICHSLRLPLWTGADLISPSGDAVMSSVIDAAEELQGILTVITALQGEKEGCSNARTVLWSWSNKLWLMIWWAWLTGWKYLNNKLNGYAAHRYGVCWRCKILNLQCYCISTNLIDNAFVLQFTLHVHNIYYYWYNI